MSGPRADPFAAYAPRLVHGWPTASRWQQRFGTLASVDLSGFTALTERLVERGREGVEEINGIVSAIFTTLIGIVDSDHGDVLSFGGDAILVWFDADDDSLGTAHQVRAVRCSAALQRTIRRVGVVPTSCGVMRLRMSVGIDSGRLLLALVGDAEQQILTLGPVATRVMELESAAEAGEVMLSEATSTALPRRWTRPVADDRHMLRLGAVPLTSQPSPSDSVEMARSSVGRTPAVSPVSLVPLPARAEVGHLVGEHRYVTIGFIRVAVDDQVATDEPAVTCALLDTFARELSSHCARRGVMWLATDIAPSSAKFIVVAGAPTSHEDDEERVLRVCREVVDHDPDLPVQIGVNSGPVFFGDLGHPQRRALTTMGDAMNLAARLMGRAAPGQIVVSRRVLDAASSDWQMQWLPPFQVKGKRAPVQAALLGAPASRRRTTGHGALVGREREFGILSAAVSSLANGVGATIDLAAPAGLGKSALVESVLASVPSDVQVVRALGDFYLSDAPYRAMAAPLRELFGVDSLAALRAVVKRHQPTLAPYLPLLAAPFGWAIADTRASRLVASEFRQDRTLAFLGSLAATALRPCVLWTDDAQWFDEASLRVLGTLSEHAAGRGVLLLCTRRPEGAVPPLASSTVLDLAPLEPDAAAALVEHAASRPLHPHVLHAIVERAAGHPFYLEALARAVSAAPESLAASSVLPESAERAAAAVLDLLPAESRALVRQLAVAGRVADLAMVAEVCNDPTLVEPRRWRACRDVVVLRDGVATFRHELYREAAYVGLAAARRRELHGRFADALLRGVGTAAERVAAAPALAAHLAQARRYPEAWEAGVAAARSAAATGAWSDADSLWNQCLGVVRHLERPPDDLTAVCSEAATTCEFLGRLPQAEALLRRASRRRPDVRTLVDLARVMQRQGELTGALRVARRALRSSTTAHDAVEATLRVASILEQKGRSTAALPLLLDLLERADLSTVQRGRAALQAQLSSLSIGDEREQQFGDLAVSLLREADGGVALGNALNNQSLAHWYAGRLGEGGRRAQEAVRVFEAVGDMTGVAVATNNLACIWLDQGRLRESEPLLLRCRRLFEAAGDRFSAACIRSALGTLALRRERFGESALLLEGARRDFVEMGADDLVLDADLRMCEVHLWRGRAVEARALADDCLQRAQRWSNGGLNIRWARRLMVWAHAQLGDLGTARVEAEQLLEEARTANAPMETALGLATLEALDKVEGRHTPASRVRERLSLMRRGGVVWVPELPVTRKHSGYQGPDSPPLSEQSTRGR